MNNVIYTKVNIFRNVKDYKFTSKIDSVKMQEIVSKLEQVLPNNYAKIDFSTASEQIKSYIINTLKLAPKYNILFLDKQNNCAITLFEGEHITITSVKQNYDPICYAAANEIATTLANKISLSFSDKYGYLMSNLSKIGSGVHIEVAIDLNAIKQLEKIEQVKANLNKLGYNLIETKNKNVFILSTTCNLGLSASEVSVDFEKTLNKLQDLEQESAKMLDVENHDAFLDSALRSMAILSSAHILTYDELKSHISTLRLGLNLGLIDIKIDTLNKLQTLSNVNNWEFISKSDSIDLAAKVKSILKGE